MHHMTLPTSAQMRPPVTQVQTRGAHSTFKTNSAVNKEHALAGGKRKHKEKGR
jgi:hypothetical protein